MSTLQKLLEAHIEKAAAEIYPHNSIRRHAFKSGAALTAPLLLAAGDGLERAKKFMDLVAGQVVPGNELEKPGMFPEREAVTEALSLIAASLKRDNEPARNERGYDPTTEG